MNLRLHLCGNDTQIRSEERRGRKSRQSYQYIDVDVYKRQIPEKSFLGQALVWPEREVDGVLKPEYNTGDGAFELAAPIYARVKGQRCV